MAKASFVKTSWESWVVAADFSDDLEDGETITFSTSTITAFDSDGTEVTSTVLDQAYKAVSGGQLQVRVEAGTSGEQYTLRYKAITSLDNQFQLDILMKVKD